MKFSTDSPCQLAMALLCHSCPIFLAQPCTVVFTDTGCKKVAYIPVLHCWKFAQFQHAYRWKQAFLVKWTFLEHTWLADQKLHRYLRQENQAKWSVSCWAQHSLQMGWDGHRKVIGKDSFCVCVCASNFTFRNNCLERKVTIFIFWLKQIPNIMWTLVSSWAIEPKNFKY